jgi:hypothetical protein
MHVGTGYDRKELLSIVEDMRTLGVTRYKTPNLELDLGPAPGKPAERPTLEEQERINKRQREFDEVMQFASSEGVPDGWYSQ